MEGEGPLVDLCHPNGLPRRRRKGHHQQGSAFPASARSAGKVARRMSGPSPGPRFEFIPLLPSRAPPRATPLLLLFFFFLLPGFRLPLWPLTFSRLMLRRCLLRRCLLRRRLLRARLSLGLWSVRRR